MLAKFIFLTLLLFSFNGYADSFVGPEASGMGGAGRGTISPGEAAFLNPASVSFVKDYFGSAFYAQGSHPLSGSTEQIGALLTDGTPDRIFQGSLGYVQQTLSPVGSTDVKTQDITVTASNFVFTNFAFGFSAHRFAYKSDVGTSVQYNGGAGLMYAFAPSWTFGLVASDILKPSSSVQPEARLNKTYSAGLGYDFDDQLNFRMDVIRPTDLNPNHKTDVLVGFERNFFRWIFVRGGFGWHEAEGPEKRVFTTGIGFNGPKLRADYGFEKDTLVASGIRHSFDLWMSF